MRLTQEDFEKARIEFRVDELSFGVTSIKRTENTKSSLNIFIAFKAMPLMAASVFKVTFNKDLEMTLSNLIEDGKPSIIQLGSTRELDMDDELGELLRDCLSQFFVTTPSAVIEKLAIEIGEVLKSWLGLYL